MTDKSEKLIVITGAAGLIGSAVVRELNRRGRENLILVDHLASSKKWLNLRSLKFRRYLERDDFMRHITEEPKLFEGDLCSAEAIIHLGACSSTMELDVSYLMKNNFEYSRALAEFSLLNNIRMVYASSAATYGAGENGYKDDESMLSELRPMNPYGYSKHIFDLWLNESGFAPLFAGIKYFNVFGPNEYHKGDMRSMVLKAFYQIVAEGKIKLFKSYRSEYRDGEQERDFYYVEDAARLTVYLALENKQACGIFNAGSGRASTWIDLAQAVFKALDKKPEIEFIEMPEAIRNSYQYHTCAPLEKIAAQGFQAEAMSLEAAVSDYISNYLLHDEKRA